MNDLGLLLGRILVLVPHQDDETACSVLLQRSREAGVVFATDGAPASEFFWGAYGSREQYAAVRRAEALQSLAVIDIANVTFLEHPVTHLPFRDQELYRSIPAAIGELFRLTSAFQPHALIVPAYEGGHPDHDACSFLASVVGHKLSVPIWEMPLYHRSQAGLMVHQEFRCAIGGEILLHPTELELRRRDQMIGKYASQPDAVSFVSAAMERFRPQPRYDYSRPPHSGALNYEVWQWGMTGLDLCAAFQNGAETLSALTLPSQQNYAMRSAITRSADGVSWPRSIL